jgi:NifU-like protein involved in Fe-S cluster formation
MDEQVIKYYRKLLKHGFPHAGKLESPSIVLDTVGENIRICGHTSQNYMLIYIGLACEKIKDIKYLCTCEPTANVVVEILCTLVKGKTLFEAAQVSADDFLRELENTGEAFLEKAKGIVELLRRGIRRYEG